MARELNKMITWNDADFMILNEGFEAGPREISGKKILTKDEIILALNADTSLMTAYTGNQTVPYNKIKSFLHTTPSSSTFDFNAGSIVVTLYVEDSHSWSLSETLSWITTSVSSGVGKTDITITRLANSGSSSRSGSITFTDTINSDTFTYNITQLANPVEAVTLFTSPSDATICASVVSSTYYVTTGLGFASSTVLYSDAAGTTFAPSQYYRQEIGDWRFWNGTSFTTSGPCGI